MNICFIQIEVSNRNTVKPKHLNFKIVSFRLKALEKRFRATFCVQVQSINFKICHFVISKPVMIEKAIVFGFWNRRMFG